MEVIKVLNEYASEIVGIEAGFLLGFIFWGLIIPAL